MKIEIVLWTLAFMGCAAAAAKTYSGQHMSCIDRAETREEAERCLADRDREWCVVDGAPNQCADGGNDDHR